MILGAEIFKFGLNFFNLLCMICGATLATYGTYMIFEIDDIFKLENLHLNSVAYATLLLGFSIFLVSFLGCCGALNDQTCLLRGYSIIMLCLAVCQVLLTCIVFLKYEVTYEKLIGFVENVWDQRASSYRILHMMEKGLKCCGKNGFEDYKNESLDIPGSCCGEDVAFECLSINAYKGGCSESLLVFFIYYSHYIKYFTVGASVVMITACLLSSYLVQNIHRKKGKPLPYHYSD